MHLVWCSVDDFATLLPNTTIEYVWLFVCLSLALSFSLSFQSAQLSMLYQLILCTNLTLVDFGWSSMEMSLFGERLVSVFRNIFRPWRLKSETNRKRLIVNWRRSAKVCRRQRARWWWYSQRLEYCCVFNKVLNKNYIEQLMKAESSECKTTAIRMETDIGAF